MGAEEPVINAGNEIVGRKVPVLGISIGAAEAAKEGWNAKKALAHAGNRNRSKQERIAATRATIIYGRRAILKTASTVAAQIPGYGTVAALALDGVNALFERRRRESQAARESLAQRRDEKAEHRRVYARNARTGRERSRFAKDRRQSVTEWGIQRPAKLLKAKL
jgi:hypothetical protein